ncbi:MAG: hypothetical protein GXP31_00735 [Kiritimatiellaeota bacterium]|nr:hypothetical protein [Kiritimatiellota bacterium]
MRSNAFSGAFAGATLVAAMCSCVSVHRVPDHPFLTEKPRILVDKVLMADNGWVMTEDHVREIKAAGFNVVSPRLGGTDPVRVRKVAAMAGRHGMFYVAWMRGSLGTKTGLKYVYPDGHDCDVFSPNSDELWQWWERTILEHARISLEEPAMAGSFLDFENYARGRAGNCYGLSYDARIMAEFARAEKIDLPDLQPAERAPWLEKRGLARRFRAFQITGWRRRARRLRQAIDRINPRYLLLLYPAPGTLFMTEALYPEWATDQAPLILCDATTYGRQTEFLSEKEALEINRAALRRNMRVPLKHRIPFAYLGGIDPVCAGADPEFCGKNASAIAQVSDGYWVFYEGPQYGKEHPEYFRWFQQANADIASGRFELWRRPRSAPENLGETVVKRKTDKLQVAVYNSRKLLQKDIESTGRYEVHPLRGMSLEYLKNFDAVVLQNFNMSLPVDHPISVNLRKYVEQGGGVLFGHDTAWFMDSIFPEIARRGRPTHNVEAERHVVDNRLVVAAAHPSIPDLEPGLTFTTEFRDHMIFRPGRKGCVIVKNVFGDPVYVVGEAGRGRVVYAGCYYGYSKELTGPERRLVLDLVDWLAGTPR